MKMGEMWGTLILIIGGLNWGLVGLSYFLKMNLNVINLILGSWPAVENLVYLVVGLAALAAVYMKMMMKKA